jgi:WD40 repeat protein
VLVLIALYIARPGQTQLRAVMSGPTPYPSITLYPTLTPTPAPEKLPRLIDADDGSATVVVDNHFSLESRAGSAIRGILADGRLLVLNAGGLSALNTDTGAENLLSQQITSDDVAFSHDGRYVTWMEGDHAAVLDGVTGRLSKALPADAHFERGLPDGGMVFTTASGPIAIVGAEGEVTDRLPTYYYPGFSPDASQYAWPAPDGLHIYDRASKATRVLPGVQSVVGGLAWAPDASRIAYLRLVGDNTVHIWVMDLGTSEQREVFAAQPMEHIEDVTFDGDTLAFHLIPADDVRSGDTFGVRYTMRADGSHVRAIGDASRPWGLCGPTCGMPPDGYENADGLARWCDLQPDGSCAFHLVFVDRTRGVTSDLLEDEGYSSAAVSPDRSRLAVLRLFGDDEVLRIISLTDFTHRDIDLGFSFHNQVAWMPDGERVLVYLGGGN